MIGLSVMGGRMVRTTADRLPVGRKPFTLSIIQSLLESRSPDPTTVKSNYRFWYHTWTRDAFCCFSAIVGVHQATVTHVGKRASQYRETQERSTRRRVAPEFACACRRSEQRARSEIAASRIWKCRRFVIPQPSRCFHRPWRYRFVFLLTQQDDC